MKICKFGCCSNAVSKLAETPYCRLHCNIFDTAKIARRNSEVVLRQSADERKRQAFRNNWRVVLTADEIYKQRDAAKKETK